MHRRKQPPMVISSVNGGIENIDKDQGDNGLPIFTYMLGFERGR